MKNLTLLILFVLFALNIFSQTTYTPKDLAGRYFYGNGYVGSSLILTDEGNYEYSSFSDAITPPDSEEGDPVTKELGSYEIKGAKIHFKIIKQTLNKYNLLDPKERAEAYKKLYNYDFKDAVIKTNYEMQIIKWDKRFYLIDFYDLYNFVAAINLGIEPRNEAFDRNYLATRFYLRIGDEEKVVRGKPNLPKEWLSFILSSPIKTKITKVTEEKRRKNYTVNKGSAEGLKVGMCFVGKNTEIEYDNLLWVTSVEKHSAKLEERSNNSPSVYKVGDILTTKSYKT